MDTEIFWNHCIQEDFKSRFVRQFFETICRQYLIRQNRSRFEKRIEDDRMILIAPRQLYQS